MFYDNMIKKVIILLKILNKILTLISSSNDWNQNTQQTKAFTVCMVMI